MVVTARLEDDGFITGRLGEVFVDLVDTLVSEFESVDLLQNLTEFTVELLPIAASGVMLADPHGSLTVVASSHESARLLELYELQTQEGPCLDCFRLAQPVVNTSPSEAVERWPVFTAAARGAGYASFHSLPMQLRDKTIGAMTLFCQSSSTLSTRDVKLGRALAAAATIGLLQERAGREKDLLSGQLQEALNSRIVIEQAKGVLAERNGVTVEAAFHALRRHARGRGQSLRGVAGEVIAGKWNGIFTP
ncbi:GAF and ANTAR domain-containing protein [Mycobacterium yunnanensis]|uniref:GAF and ANTAR domain-containing protein n=1 Tax=Mycobacterium yunnanensis TaxID=368477 RepID=A0A9X3BVH8_9MYCO|nr:GAF and ANTAR domain-containing protein [Mycobacterium yunnanensis]MCV7423754.1 GAF and ANTAR domain-containing protein [Mycobacterium yunnanensis]